VATWTRKVFDCAGLTQVPPGPALELIQNRHRVGVVMLLIDVSGSMSGDPLLQAVLGAKQFVGEAVEANYQVGVMLWNTHVVAMSMPSADAGPAMAVLNSAMAGGDTHLIGPLARAHEVLDGFVGDRVVAIFGDGDLTPKADVMVKVALMKSQNIRFVTRGLGIIAAREFGEISDEEAEQSRVDRVEDLAQSIAGMATALRIPRSSPPPTE